MILESNLVIIKKINKILEMLLDYELNSKLNNELLIDKLKEFQVESNILMCIFVDKEILIKNINQPDSDQNSDEVEEDVTEAKKRQEIRATVEKKNLIM